MTKSYTVAGLNRFLRDFSRSRVCISKDIDGHTINQYLPNCTPSVGYVIASYSRVRDARRALKKLGYVQEGLSWKPPVRAVIEPDVHHPLVADAIEFNGVLSEAGKEEA